VGSFRRKAGTLLSLAKLPLATKFHDVIELLLSTIILLLNDPNVLLNYRRVEHRSYDASHSHYYMI
jgi:hypothetical protein